MRFLLLVQAVFTLRLDQRKQKVLSWVRKDIDLSKFFTDEVMESSVLIVQVNRDFDKGRLTERKHSVAESFEGGDSSQTISDLCKFCWQ